MKKFFLACIFAPGFIFSTGHVFAKPTFTGDTPGEQVIQAFNKDFKDAQQVQWWWDEKVSHYRSTFHFNGILHRVQYDEMGKLLSAISYYSMDQIPNDVRNIFKKHFRNKTLWSITKVITEGGTGYYGTLYSNDDTIKWCTYEYLEGSSSDYDGKFAFVQKFKQGNLGLLEQLNKK